MAALSHHSWPLAVQETAAAICLQASLRLCAEALISEVDPHPHASTCGGKPFSIVHPPPHCASIRAIIRVGKSSGSFLHKVEAGEGVTRDKTPSSSDGMEARPLSTLCFLLCDHRAWTEAFLWWTCQHLLASLTNKAEISESLPGTDPSKNIDKQSNQ